MKNSLQTYTKIFYIGNDKFSYHTEVEEYNKRSAEQGIRIRVAEIENIGELVRSVNEKISGILISDEYQINNLSRNKRSKLRNLIFYDKNNISYGDISSALKKVM